MHLTNQFDKNIVLKGSFSGKWCWNGPRLGPTGNFKMCKENVSIYVYHVQSVGNFAKVVVRLIAWRHKLRGR